MNAKALLLAGLAGVVPCLAQAPAHTPFRIRFQGYDGDGKASHDKMTFQLIPLDAGGRSKFVKLGETIEGTKWKPVKFEYKERKNPLTGDQEEVSELTIQNTETSRTAVLIFNSTIDVSK